MRNKRNWFWTSDIHAYHSNIIKYCDRPFMSNVEKGLQEMAKKGVIPPTDYKISYDSARNMTETIVTNINAVVKEDDVLVHLGDFIFGPRNDFFEHVRNFRKKINCRNIILIWGNHDDQLRDLLNNTGYFEGMKWRNASLEANKLFMSTHDQYLFNIDGQKIFCNHYPMRSWDCAHHGAWMLYGHVHNLFKYEDNGQLQKRDELCLREKFEQALWGANLGGSLDEIAKNDLIQDLIDSVASLKGIDLTVDVGVDNTIRPVPWGTPWSMDDLQVYMQNKKAKWDARQLRYKD